MINWYFLEKAGSYYFWFCYDGNGDKVYQVTAKKSPPGPKVVGGYYGLDALKKLKGI